MPTSQKIVIGGLFSLFAMLVLGAGIYNELTTTDVEDLEVGQCLKDWDDFTGGKSGEYVPPDVTNADCGEPHAMEVFYIEELPSTRVGLDNVSDGEVNKCIAQFDSFVGLDWLDSELEIFAVVTADGFGSRNRRLVCLIGHEDSETLVSGTLRGSRR